MDGFYLKNDNWIFSINEAMEKNEFIIPNYKLSGMFVIGRSDLEFYCYDQTLNIYFRRAQGGLDVFDEYQSFNELLKHIISD